MALSIKHRLIQHATQDGEGVKIRRIADFRATRLDPFLMIDELRSDQSQDYIGGFPPHPHRGIETFTYIRKGGFEHRDQMGNRAAIRAGGSQWMSTGSGVVHSEMPLADAEEGLHGFQIWLNMPAKDKMRPSRYADSSAAGNPELHNTHGAALRLLAGDWRFGGDHASAPLSGLAGNAALADLMLPPGAQAELDLRDRQQVALFVYEGSLDEQNIAAGQIIVVDASETLSLRAGPEGANLLVLTGEPIREKIAHWGPFVMNSQQEIEQAISDYQSGKFGQI